MMLLYVTTTITAVFVTNAFTTLPKPRTSSNKIDSYVPSTTRLLETKQQHQKHQHDIPATTSVVATTEKGEESIYELLAKTLLGPFITIDTTTTTSTDQVLAMQQQRRTQTYYTNTVSLLRVGLPSLFLAGSAKISYPIVAMSLANAIHDSGVFAVVAQDASQYIQNILTTSGLMFSILVGQTYYFMYQVSECARRGET
jgi:hypothetical protein